MATFGAWLDGQRHRTDAVGEMARHWASIKGERRIRALPSVEAELKQRGSLAAGSPVAVWWEQTMTEYRAQKNAPTTISGRPLVSVPDAPEGPTGDSHADLAGFQQWAGQQMGPTIGVTGTTVTHVTASLDQLDRIEAKLDWVHAWLMEASGPELAAAVPPWPGDLLPLTEPMDWAGLSELADYDAAQDGG